MATTQDVRFRRLYNEHRNAVVAYCVRRANREDAMEAAAETFAVAWRRIEELPVGEAQLSWLYAVAFRVLSNQRRGRRRFASLQTKLASTATESAPDPQD